MILSSQSRLDFTQDKGGWQNATTLPGKPGPGAGEGEAPALYKRGHRKSKEKNLRELSSGF